MRIPLHTLLNKFNSEPRSIYLTEPGEVRFFKISGDDRDREIRVTGTEDGGLLVEENKNGTWSINTTALPRLGETATEVYKK